MTDWIYHHKAQIIVFFLLLIGGISGVLALGMEANETEENQIISDTLVEQIDENTTEETSEKDEPINEEVNILNVDIKGAVKKPGVYQVSDNTRIVEVISLAGGLQDQAYTKNINLSKKVSDEMVIYVFTKDEYEQKSTCAIKNEYSSEISEEIEKKNSVITDSPSSSIPNKISLNQATLEQLITIDGIGETKAKSIIEYRNTHGLFQNVEDLKLINGIGESLYEKIKDYFTI